MPAFHLGTRACIYQELIDRMVISLTAVSLLLTILVFAAASVAKDSDNKANSGLRPRNSAPLFKAKSVIDDKFREVALSDYTSSGQWVVLVIIYFI